MGVEGSKASNRDNAVARWEHLPAPDPVIQPSPSCSESLACGTAWTTNKRGGGVACAGPAVHDYCFMYCIVLLMAELTSAALSCPTTAFDELLRQLPWAAVTGN